MSKPDPNKWKVSNFFWADFKWKVLRLIDAYCKEGFNQRDDVTKAELKREVCERMAEFCGYKIVWPEKEQSK